MLEIINNTPALLLVLALLPALLIAAIVYFIINNKWQKQYNELQGYYEQSQIDAKNLRKELNDLREELAAEKRKLNASKQENTLLENKVIALENEIEEEIQDKNEQLSKLEVRLESLEKELSLEKLKNIPQNLAEKKKEKSVFETPNTAKEVTEILDKPVESLKDKLTGFFKRITTSNSEKPASEISDAEIIEDEPTSKDK